MAKYRSIVFLQDPAEFDKWYVEFDDDPQEGLMYLLQWEYGDNIPEEDVPGWGTHDTIEYFDYRGARYAISYNWNLSYVGLVEIL